MEKNLDLLEEDSTNQIVISIYRIHLCIVPYFGTVLSKKKNIWSGYEKIASWFGNTLKTTLDHLFRNVTRCTGHKMISSSNGLFWRSAFVKSWILSTVHSIQRLDYSRNTMVRELRSICEELELNWSLLLRILLHIFQSRDLQRCNKQAGCSISPGHHVADTELQIFLFAFLRIS